MIDIHLEKLINIKENEQGYLGNNSLDWANSVIPKELLSSIDTFLDKRFDRYELFKYCDNPVNSDLNALTAILSWGGMQRGNARNLFKNKESLYPLIHALRNKNFKTRQSAFEAFKIEREIGNLPGLGIGYFTKLICFLSPDLNGYIMDQWAGKSINFLTGKKIVKFTGDWVNDHNNEITYETFCSYIDTLAIKLNCTGFEAEKRIFSVGGKNKGEWRNYLISNY